MYFANLEGRDCGVPMLHEVGIARSGTKVLVADELDAMNGDQCIRQIMGELLEDMRKRTEEYIDAMVTKEVLAEAQAEARDLIEAARTLAEQSAYSTEEVLGAILNALGGYDKSKNTRRALNGMDLAAIQERKEAREKLRAAERENAARFRQYRARESTWATRKRTGQRRREWRGPWREKNN